MAAVALHPIASRSGVQSATVVSVNLHSDGENDPLQSQQIFGSSPTTRAFSPNLFDDRNSQQAASLDLDSEAGDSEGSHSWHEEADGLEFGLQHEDIDQYPVLIQDDEKSLPSIRAMTASQFADLQQRYADLDVPHSIMFPFLHGVDGDNAAQNAFFRAPLTGMPTPLYRGLTVIRADMPTHEQQQAMHRKRTSSSASKLSHIAGSQRSRATSIATTASTFSTDSYSSGEEDNDLGDLPIRTSSQVTTSNSTSSVSSSTTCSDYSRNSSLFSRAMSSDTSTSSTCVDMDKQKTVEGEATAPYLQLTGRHPHTRRAPVYEPQPRHSLLNSTIMPSEVISPPLMANLDSNSLEVAQQSSLPTGNYCWINGASFVKPKQADGISLRNFKTQCAKYATISDIVIYCPAGLHQGVLTLAHWARQAQETCYRERMGRGLGGLRYNVFVITGKYLLLPVD
jgi:dual specificity MAP kinase phosphatase